eukprot:2622169-Pleurochrysis_carterae.AAC.8
MRCPGCEGVYRSPGCGKREAFASAHEAQAGGEACRRLRGASDVTSVSRLRLALPQCRRRCMYIAASLAGITWMCDVARDE